MANSPGLTLLKPYTGCNLQLTVYFRQLHRNMVYLPNHKRFTEQLIDTTWPSSLLDIRNSDGLTAMHLAAMGNQADIVRRLLVSGANPMCRDNYGYIPLHYASRKSHTDTMNALMKALDSKETMKMQSKQLMIPDLSQCINERNNQGETPLHIAAEYGHFDNVKLLLDVGADFDLMRYNNGHRPLHIAILKGHKKITKLILKYFDANPKDNLQDKYCCPELMQPLQLMGLDGAFLRIFKIPVGLLYPQQLSDKTQKI